MKLTIFFLRVSQHGRRRSSSRQYGESLNIRRRAGIFEIGRVMPVIHGAIMVGMEWLSREGKRGGRKTQKDKDEQNVSRSLSAILVSTCLLVGRLSMHFVGFLSASSQLKGLWAQA